METSDKHSTQRNTRAVQCIVCNRLVATGTGRECVACSGVMHSECAKDAERCPRAKEHNELVSMVCAMGFGVFEAEVALSRNNRNVERAVNWLIEHPDEAASVARKREEDDKAEEQRLKMLQDAEEKRIILAELMEKEKLVEEKAKEMLKKQEYEADPIDNESYNNSFVFDETSSMTKCESHDLFSNRLPFAEALNHNSILLKGENDILLQSIAQMSDLLNTSFGHSQLFLQSFDWDSLSIVRLFTNENETEISNLLEENNISTKKPFYEYPKEFINTVTRFSADSSISSSNNLITTDSYSQEKQKLVHEVFSVSKGTCSVCYEESNIISLRCEHGLCANCWKLHILALFQQHDPGLARCYACESRLDFLTIWLLSSDKEFQFYWNFARNRTTCAKSHSISCRHCGSIRLCESPQPHSNTSCVCVCGARQCNQCAREVHLPSMCLDLQKWSSLGDSESASMKRIKALSKPCPHCGVMTERNDGCFHMTCKKCKGQWCWLCRGDWRTHGSHTGGLYRCNLYDTSEAKKLDDEAKKEITETNNFITYLSLYTPFHKTAEHFSENKFSLLRKMKQKTNTEQTLHYSDILGNAIDAIIAANNFGKYAQVFKYYHLKSYSNSQWYFFKSFLDLVIDNANLIAEELNKEQIGDLQTIRRKTLLILHGIERANEYAKYEMTFEEKKGQRSFYFPTNVTIGCTFHYSGKPFDKNGLIYWLGTLGGKKTFQNPTKLDIGIICTRSSEDKGTANDVLEYRPIPQWTANEGFGYWQVDLGDYAILPTSYSLRTYTGSGLLRNWIFQGSNDGSHWVDLMKHTNDESLVGTSTEFTWKLPVIDRFFRFLRVQMTGPNSQKDHYLTLSSFEVYGTTQCESVVPRNTIKK